MAIWGNKKLLPEDSLMVPRLLKKQLMNAGRRNSTTTKERRESTRKRTTVVKPRRTSLKTKTRESLSGSNLLSHWTSTSNLLPEEVLPNNKERVPQRTRNPRLIWATVE
jgi:hypothetical protein